MYSQRMIHYALVALLGGSLVLMAPSAGQARDWQKVLKDVTQSGGISGTTTSVPGTSGLNDSEVGAGLKEALASGVSRAIEQLGRDDGFWSNSAVRIPLPGTLRKAGEVAGRLGQGAQFEAFQRTLNQAAEKAVPEVADIFGNAIRQMSLTDARNILTGGDHAATDYFRRTAGEALTTRIQPIVASSTDAVGVTRGYKELIASDAVGGTLGKLQSLGGGGASASADSLDLDRYVTDRTIDGLFHVIAEQEAAIRNNPAARTTDLLRKVFGR